MTAQDASRRPQEPAGGSNGVPASPSGGPAERASEAHGGPGAVEMADEFGPYLEGALKSPAFRAAWEKLDEPQKQLLRRRVTLNGVTYGAWPRRHRLRHRTQFRIVVVDALHVVQGWPLNTSPPPPTPWRWRRSVAIEDGLTILDWIERSGDAG